MRGSIVLDRQEPYLDASELDALIQMWLEECADRLDDVGPNGFTGTTLGYASKIAYFRDWWAEIGESVGWRLTQRRLREFERWLRMRESKYGEALSYHTRRDVLRRLRAMFRWAQAAGYIMHAAPAAWVPAPVGDPPVRSALPDEALSALMAAAASTSMALRNVTILAVLIGTGIRRQECAALTVGDVTLAEDGSGSLLIRQPKRTSRGLKVRPVAFDVATGEHLRRWLASTPSRQANGPLFPSAKTGGHLTPLGLGRMVRRCYDLAGLDVGQPVHDLRRAFITDWRRRHRGEDMDDLLRRQVGHVDGEMTSLYSLQGVDDVRAVIDSPMGRVGVAVADWPLMNRPMKG